MAIFSALAQISYKPQGLCCVFSYFSSNFCFLFIRGVRMCVYKKSHCETMLIFCLATENLSFSIRDAQPTSLTEIPIEIREEEKTWKCVHTECTQALFLWCICSLEYNNVHFPAIIEKFTVFTLCHIEPP